MQLAILDALNTERAARRACVLITELASGRQRLVKAEQAAADVLAVDLLEALRSGRSGPVESAAGQVLLTAIVPSPRLVITGAVHISQALAPMARAVGFAVVIIDPRTAFATAERFAGTDVRALWPEEVLPELKLDAFTAFAALSHEGRIDDLALIDALRAGCFYVGALGSRRTHAARLERLAAAGVSPEARARICGPIGLAIGAVSPSEIAVSILAEIIGTLRRTPQGKDQAT